MHESGLCTPTIGWQVAVGCWHSRLEHSPTMSRFLPHTLRPWQPYARRSMMSTCAIAPGHHINRTPEFLVRILRMAHPWPQFVGPRPQGPLRRASHARHTQAYVRQCWAFDIIILWGCGVPRFAQLIEQTNVYLSQSRSGASPMTRQYWAALNRGSMYRVQQRRHLLYVWCLTEPLPACRR